MKECGLGKISSLKGNTSPHQSEKDNRKCDDSQPADLHKKQSYDLPGDGQVFTDIQNAEARDAYCRGGCEKGVYKTNMTAMSGKRKIEEDGSYENHGGETEDEKFLWTEVS
jgi:hypothetical protein